MTITKTHGSDALAPQNPYSTTPWRSDATVSTTSRKSLQDLTHISPVVMPIIAAGYVLSLPLLAGAGWWLWQINASRPLAVVLCIALMIAAARQMRAMECLVHEASHYNFNRRRKTLNDWMANLTSAWPLLSHVENYRSSHYDHHRLIGTKSDICHQRYYHNRMDRLDRSSARRFITVLLTIFPRYSIDWFRAIGSNKKVIFVFGIWHGVVIGTAALAIAHATGTHNESATGIALSLWLLYFFIPFAFILPFLRMIGEAGEHPYERSWGTDNTDIFDATINNIGWVHRLLIHPFGDGYHLMHHLFPAIPGYRLARAHEILATEGGDFSKMKYRHGVLQPRTTSA